jgi:hypothetical protein
MASKWVWPKLCPMFISLSWNSFRKRNRGGGQSQANRERKSHWKEGPGMSELGHWIGQSKLKIWFQSNLIFIPKFSESKETRRRLCWTLFQQLLQQEQAFFGPEKRIFVYDCAVLLYCTKDLGMAPNQSQEFVLQVDRVRRGGEWDIWNWGLLSLIFNYFWANYSAFYRA